MIASFLNGFSYAAGMMAAFSLLGVGAVLLYRKMVTG